MMGDCVAADLTASKKFFFLKKLEKTKANLAAPCSKTQGRSLLFLKQARFISEVSWPVR